MSFIDVQNLTFAYEGSYDNLFEDVSFRLDGSWKLGLVGRNGRGKTTLLNLFMGKYEYSGAISSGLVFQYFPFDVPDQSRTPLEIAESKISGFEEWRLLRELSLLSVEEDVLTRPFYTLSNGEQTKVLLAVLFLNEHAFLLIDEPTNHLDTGGREIVSRYLNGKQGFILVSHDRAFLDGCIDHVLSINRNNIELQKGNFSSWEENKRRQDEFELAENRRLKKDIRRLSEAAKQTADWSDKVEKTKSKKNMPSNSGTGKLDKGYIGHQAAKMMQRSKNIETRRLSAAEEKEGLLKNLETAESLKLSPLPYHSRRLLSLEKLSLFYGEKAVCENVAFTVEAGDRVALTGRNGSGKCSLLKLIGGQEIAFCGGLQKGSGLVISAVPQDTSFLKGNLREYAGARGIGESLFLAILRKLDFARVQFEKDMADFSGGQKKKVLIAASLCEKAHLYLWDEPLNFIDVFSRMQIEELLLSFCPTMVFVEHDRAFCEKIATKTVAL